MNICIVVANYYKDISNNLIDGAIKELDKYNKAKKSSNKIKYKKITVPGVFEIPFIVSTNIKKFDAFICLGCVIKGETPHFDIISKASINAILNITIEHNKIITNGIITSLNKSQAIVRSNIGEKNKGTEAARALIKLINL